MLDKWTVLMGVTASSVCLDHFGVRDGPCYGGYLTNFLRSASFSISLKLSFHIKHHIDIRQVSAQLSCGDTWPISMWCGGYNRYLLRYQTCLLRRNERVFSDPHHWPVQLGLNSSGRGQRPGKYINHINIWPPDPKSESPDLIKFTFDTYSGVIKIKLNSTDGRLYPLLRDT